MHNGSIETIIFDLGGVLIDFDHRIAAKRIMRFCNKSVEEIFALFFSSGITTLFEKGEISPAEFFQKVKEMLGLKLNYQTFVPIWNEIFFLTAKNRAVFSLANTLRQDYRIAVLSNINILHFAYLEKHFPIFAIFDHVFTSFTLGAVKPDPAIYQKVLQRLNNAAESVFYTDDRQELVESASSLGIKSLLFSSAAGLKEGLLNSGANIC